MNLVSMLAASVRQFGNRPLLGRRTTDGWAWTSYAAFARAVDALRGGLAALGVGRGDRVAIISRNRVEWAVACYATAGLGAAFVPLHERQAERDWRSILADSGARVCFVPLAAAGSRAACAACEVPSVEYIVDLDAQADAPFGYLGLSRRGEVRPVEATSPDGADLATIVYTPGTTGRPKGVLLTHANVVSNVAAVTQVLPVSPEDRSLSLLPWGHVFGGDELHGVVNLGASMGICDRIDEIGRDLCEVRPTLLCAPPRLWHHIHQSILRSLSAQPRIVQEVFARGRAAARRAHCGERLSARASVELAVAERFVLSRLRDQLGGRVHHAVSSAAALSPEVAGFFDDLGIVVLEAYGLTETSACATINRPGDRRSGSVGKPVPGVRVTLDHRVPGGDDQTGEIVVHGHGTMVGYAGPPEETRTATTDDGGVRTGDMGRFDGDGFLYVTGRVKELYKLDNGRYVSPAPLEEILTRSPFIDQAFVHGANRPHNVALVVPNQDAVSRWARAHGVRAPCPGEVGQDSALRPVLEAELDAASRFFRGYERIRAFAVIEEPFSTDNGLLTPTLKVRRTEILRRYRPVLDALYQGDVHAQPAPPH